MRTQYYTHMASNPIDLSKWSTEDLVFLNSQLSVEISERERCCQGIVVWRMGNYDKPFIGNKDLALFGDCLLRYIFQAKYANMLSVRLRFHPLFIQLVSCVGEVLSDIFES